MQPWRPPHPDDEAETRRRLLEKLRLLAAGNRTSLVRLGSDLRVVLHNRVETRRLLAGSVYGVPDGWLDDILRVRLHDLDR